MYRWVQRNNKTLPVEIHKVPIPVRSSARRKTDQGRPWPVIYLSSWFKVAFQEPYGGFFFLAGQRLTELDEVKKTLSRFWSRYRGVEPNFVFPERPDLTIPFYVHGDEGRGYCKRPVLVVSAQPVFGWTSDDNANSKKTHACFMIDFDCFCASRFCGYSFGLQCLLPAEAHIHHSPPVQPDSQGALCSRRRFYSRPYGGLCC